MEPKSKATSKFHVLLVGIDDYAHKPLAGCVHDVEAVERVLVGPRMAIDAGRITRLLAPRSGAAHEARPTDRRPTLDNLRAALAALGSDQVAPGDQVFIYYSGHGSRIAVTDGGPAFHREALVPVDHKDAEGKPNVLYDFELNQLLRAIAARTRRVTLILDCCHAAGATREGIDPPAWTARYLDPVRAFGLTGPLRVPPGVPPGATPGAMPGAKPGAKIDRPSGPSLARGVDDCQVVAACLGHEYAKEGPDGRGTQHGLLTRAFLTALDGVRDRELRTTTWAAIWQPLRAELERTNPGQHAWMSGNAARRVFAGPPVTGDPGFSVERADGSYQIEAGSLAGVTRGAELAIYPEVPSYFPALGSPDDVRLRAGVVVVTEATPGTAIAAPRGLAFDLPPGARGRMIKPGESARITYAIDPQLAPAVAGALAGSPLLERVTPPAVPAVRLEHHDGRWIVSDSVHGRGDDGPILFALQPAELDCARAVMEHYYAYSRPFRMAEAAIASNGSLAGGLAIQVLACPADRELSPAEAQVADLPPAPSTGGAAYALSPSHKVCFAVRNTSLHQLRVTLVNAGASGRVQILGDQIIDPSTRYVFWAHNALGAAFRMVPPTGAAVCADRLVAIGRTAVTRELDYLRVDRTFASIIQRTRNAETDRDIDIEDAMGHAGELDHWTAAEVVITTRR
ncbi:MAG TPA: caspase family protein [Kofleriaceae bacterium]|jgi:hypothetical protein|nr:caspase family protein [Kofleriaceae bacterium]